MIQSWKLIFFETIFSMAKCLEKSKNWPKRQNRSWPRRWLAFFSQLYIGTQSLSPGRISGKAILLRPLCPPQIPTFGRFAILNFKMSRRISMARPHHTPSPFAVFQITFIWIVLSSQRPLHHHIWGCWGGSKTAFWQGECNIEFRYLETQSGQRSQPSTENKSLSTLQSWAERLVDDSIVEAYFLRNNI